jgi:hypothetical protein
MQVMCAIVKCICSVVENWKVQVGTFMDRTLRDEHDDE